MDRHRKQLEVVFKPETKPRGEVLPSDVKEVIVGEEQQEWSSSVEQEDPEPPHIKEEQEELCTSQEGEQLQGLEEADITAVPVKSEDDEEKAQSSQLHHRLTEQMETEADGEDCGGPEPARNSHPHTHLQPDTDEEAGDSSETEVSDGNWEETREVQSGLNSVKNDELPVSDSRCSAGEKPFSCPECEKRFVSKTRLKEHLRCHTGEKPYSCSVCKKSFTQSGNLETHMRIHTGEKPFSCSECGKRFGRKAHLKGHMITHTGEKTFSCSLCEKSYTESGNLQKHMRTHTGEKPFSCSVCGKCFIRKAYVKTHMRTHTGETPFSCSFCAKSYKRKASLIQHMTHHTGEKRFSCSVCDRRFTWHFQLRNHQCVGRQLHQSQTEENGEAEPPAGSSDPQTHLQPDTEDKTGDSFVAEIEVSIDDWEETREPQSGLIFLKKPL